MTKDLAELLEAQLVLLFDDIDPNLRSHVIRSYFDKRGLAIVNASSLNSARMDFDRARDKLLEVERIMGLPNGSNVNTQASALSHFMGNPYPYTV